MKQKLFPVAAMAGLLTLTGCVGTNAMKSLNNLKDNNATDVLTLITPWGQQKLVRTNPRPGQSVTIGADGSITITGESASNGIPALIVGTNTFLRVR